MPIKAALPALISAAGSLAGGALSMGGKGGGGDSESARRLADQQADLARQQLQIGQDVNRTVRPLRVGTAGVLNEFLQSGQTPAFLDLPQNVQPLASLSLPALEDQRNLLQRRLRAGGIRGGQLQGQLAQADLQGALQRSQLMQQDLLRQEGRDIDRANIRRGLFSGATDLGMGGTATALQGMAGASGANASALSGLMGLSQLQQQRDIMSSQGAGQLLGKGLSTATGFLPSSALSGTVMGSKLKV